MFDLNISLVFIFSVIVLNASQCGAKSDDRSSVQIGDNEYIGSEKVVLDKTVHVFTGIPYAEPPLQELRFKKPLPVTRNGVFESNEWPKACPQIDTNVPQSEDCLKLNVWTTDLSASKPVMVWFHGGGFQYGSGHNGEVLAVAGDVVVVTLNYRLGALGFLYGDRDDAPGNMGLWDQVLALEWVNDNIRYFGGNQQQITLFGFSAGSRSISLHLLSEHSRQLFRNAIMMSGSALSLLTNSDKSYVHNIYLKLAKHVGCSAGDTGFTDDVMTCLRGVPHEKLVSAQHSAEVLDSNFAFFPNYIFGDPFMREGPLDMVDHKETKKKINLLLGTTEDEGSWIWNKINENKALTHLTKTEAIEELESIFNGLKVDPKIDGQSVAKFYMNKIPDTNPDVFMKTVGIAVGDFFITCPALKFADIIYRADPKHNKVYGYYWTSKGRSCDEWAGACHGSDVGPALGYPFRSTKSSDLQRDVSMNFMKTIAYFAKYK
ncbi:unnamed protein product [Oppiella nova]|uniref:Carboxylic ester hydrolase n=1 Tax=Oppiella nova TaxID=334625 RepID=A0A7R9M433_9ACAR|nr:unnamed protein product [Oppiella nova]CAG2170297.1 unnamed protein product [Oppiella nova]